VYGAGAVLWEQLAGRRLFRAESEGALLQKILAGPEYTPQQVNADVPAALDAVCMRALARSPDDRYATAADFADALEEAAATAGITIASTRTLARFVDESGAHEKLDPRRIAELRQGPRDPMASIPSRPSLSSYDDSHSGSGQGSAPSVSRGRSVTGAVATLSASHQPTPKRSSRTILVGGALLLAGVAGGFVLAQRGGGAESGDRVDASPAAVAAPEAAPEAVATSTPALASASAGVDEPSDEATGDSAPSDATPTASASAPPPKSTPKPLRAAAPRPPKPRPAAKPTSNSYDPDRL
jgi:serine/threonine-protein kinase